MFVITPRMLLRDPAQIRNRLVSGSLVRHMRQLAAQTSATDKDRGADSFRTIKTAQQPAAYPFGR